MKTKIHNYVNNIVDSDINKIFSRYNDKYYKHLMDNNIIELDNNQKRKALYKYMKYIIIDDIGERQEVLMDLVENNNYASLSRILEDQYYEEPLYHIANESVL